MYGKDSERQMYAASNHNGRVNSVGGQMYNNFGTCYAGSAFSMPSTVPVMDNRSSLSGQVHQFQSRPPVATAFPGVDYRNPAQATLCQQLQFPYRLQNSPQVGNGDAYSIVSSRGCTVAAGKFIPPPRQQLQACPPVCQTTCTNQPLATTSSRVRQGASASTAASEDDCSRTVFVENIPKTVTLKEVINFFKTAGDLEFSERTGQLNVRLIIKHGIPTGEAVLQYASRTGAEKALAMFCDACFPPLQMPMRLTIAYGPYWSSNSDSSLKKLKHSFRGTQSKESSTGKHKQRIIQRDSGTLGSEEAAHRNANKAVKNSAYNSRHKAIPYFGIPKRFIDPSKSWLCWHCCNMNSLGDTCLFCHRKDSMMPK